MIDMMDALQSEFAGGAGANLFHLSIRTAGSGLCVGQDAHVEV